jgi:hypothetical protein
MLAALAHCPAVGVNVYVVVAVLFIAGDQVPVMLLFEVVGKLNEPPAQIADTCVKVGVVLLFTVTTAALEVAEHELELVTTTVYEPAAVAV